MHTDSLENKHRTKHKSLRFYTFQCCRPTAWGRQPNQTVIRCQIS